MEDSTPSHRYLTGVFGSPSPIGDSTGRGKEGLTSGFELGRIGSVDRWFDCYPTDHAVGRIRYLGSVCKPDGAYEVCLRGRAKRKCDPTAGNPPDDCTSFVSPVGTTLLAYWRTLLSPNHLNPTTHRARSSSISYFSLAAPPL